MTARKEGFAAIALDQANKIAIAQSASPEEALRIAGIYYGWLVEGGDEVTAAGKPVVKVVEAVKPVVAAKPAAAAAAAAAKPAAAKTAAKPKAEPAVNPKFQIVKGLVKTAIESHLRGEVLELLDSYGANSTTSLIALGDETTDAFITAATALIEGVATEVDPTA